MSAIENIDCPICMECVDQVNNRVVTECGHCFHTNCLMQSVAHNGFGCPYCRTKMADEPEEDKSTEYTEIEDDEEGEEMFSDYALRGLRFFNNQIEGIEHGEDDLHDEEEEDVEEDEEDTNDAENVNVPSVDFVSDKLKQQGITYEKLVSMILYQDHEEYDKNNVMNERFMDELFGKIRIIVSNYNPEQTNVAAVEEPVVLQQQSLNAITIHE